MRHTHLYTLRKYSSHCNTTDLGSTAGWPDGKPSSEKDARKPSWSLQKQVAKGPFLSPSSTGSLELEEGEKIILMILRCNKITKCKKVEGSAYSVNRPYIAEYFGAERVAGEEAIPTSPSCAMRSLSLPTPATIGAVSPAEIGHHPSPLSAGQWKHSLEPRLEKITHKTS